MKPNIEKKIAESRIQIKSPVSRVWDVIVKPEFIKQWDDIPDDFKGDSLVLGSVLEWVGSARLTVTICDLNSRLRLQYHNPKWEKPVDGIDYEYELQEKPVAPFCLQRSVIGRKHLIRKPRTTTRLQSSSWPWLS